MSVRIEDEVIHLHGRCQAEDAELLLVALQEAPVRAVDLTQVRRMHLAVAQILLAVRPSVRGMPEDAFLARHFVNLLE